MKRNLRIEKLCFGFMLVIAVQLALLLIIRIRITSSTTNHGQVLLTTNVRNTSMSIITTLTQSSESIICDRSHDNYEWCILNRASMLEPNTTTFYTVGSPSQDTTTNPPSTEKIRPYPRKWEKFTMSLVSEIILTTSPTNKACEIYHDAPALVFSVSGYTGNFFHDFNDGIIPLYITINTLFPNQDVTLVVANFTNWWYSKYEVLLNAFTRHRIVNLDNQTSTNCFPSVAVGLISHGPMTMIPDDMYKKSSFLEFRSLLEKAYNKCNNVTPLRNISGNKPRVVFMSRTGNVGRVILNQKDIIEIVEQAGFEVEVFQPTKYTYLCDAYRLINASHGMIGVHGAALTHSIFLRPGSMLIQIVPLGNEWLADSYFKNLAMGLRFDYIEYKIRSQESSLAATYGLNHRILRNPNAIIRGNWSALDSIYLKGQDVRLDLDRFQNYMVLAYSKARRFMENIG